MKPIETIYNGYRFRSRLEARWAVFFDELEIDYQYEPEGFQFDDGTLYLPDFWLPRHDTWIEIKAAGAPIQPEEWEKVLSFSRFHDIYVTFGQPVKGELWAALFQDGSWLGGTLKPEEETIRLCTMLFVFNLLRFISKDQDPFKRWDDASAKARQARFGKGGRG